MNNKSNSYKIYMHKERLLCLVLESRCLQGTGLLITYYFKKVVCVYILVDFLSSVLLIPVFSSLKLKFRNLTFDL